MQNSTYIRFLRAFLFSLLSTPVIAYASLTLPNDTWKQVVVPGNSSTLTIGAVFGNSLGVSSLGKDWAVFEFSSASQRYHRLRASDTISQSSGVWIIQRKGRTIEISVPDMLPYVRPTSDSFCPKGNTCTRVLLPSRTDGKAWAMIGQPSMAPEPMSSLIVVSAGDGSVCESGCSYADAVSASLVSSGYSYSDRAGSYLTVDPDNPLPAWSAYWIATRNTSNQGDIYLLQLIAQTVNETLPPDPGTAGQDTVAGVDSNRNGVRDDVERVIRTLDYESKLPAVMQTSAALQQALIRGSGSSQRSLQDIGNTLTRSADCLFDRFGPTDAARVASIISFFSVNTPERQAAMQNFLNQTDGTQFATNRPGEACD